MRTYRREHDRAEATTVRCGAAPLGVVRDDLTTTAALMLHRTSAPGIADDALPGGDVWSALAQWCTAEHLTDPNPPPYLCELRVSWTRSLPSDEGTRYDLLLGTLRLAGAEDLVLILRWAGHRPPRRIAHSVATAQGFLAVSGVQSTPVPDPDARAYAVRWDDTRRRGPFSSRWGISRRGIPVTPLTPSLAAGARWTPLAAHRVASTIEDALEERSTALRQVWRPGHGALAWIAGDAGARPDRTGTGAAIQGSSYAPPSESRDTWAWGSEETGASAALRRVLRLTPVPVSVHDLVLPRPPLGIVLGASAGGDPVVVPTDHPLHLSGSPTSVALVERQLSARARAVGRILEVSMVGDAPSPSWAPDVGKRDRHAVSIQCGAHGRATLTTPNGPLTVALISTHY